MDMYYLGTEKHIIYGYILLGYGEAQGTSAIPVQGLRYEMYIRIMHTYQGRIDLDQIS